MGYYCMMSNKRFIGWLHDKDIYQNTRKLAIVLKIVSDSRRENTIRSILVSVDILCQSCGDIGSIGFSWNGRGGVWSKEVLPHHTVRL